MGAADNRVFIHGLVFIFPFAAAPTSDWALYKEQKNIRVQRPITSSFPHGDKHLQVRVKYLAKILFLMHKIFSCYYVAKRHARLRVRHCCFSLNSRGGAQLQHPQHQHCVCPAMPSCSRMSSPVPVLLLGADSSRWLEG